MNSKEIIDKLKQILWDENDLNRSEFANRDISSKIEAEVTKALGEWEYRLIADRPFGETDVQRTVIFFKEHNVFLAYDGYYDSWSGGSWDEAHFYEVKPVERTFTDWESV